MQKANSAEHHEPEVNWEEPTMSITRLRSSHLALLAVSGSVLVTGLGTYEAAAQGAPNCPTMRTINVGISVSPPNVVHTSPYVAKAFGYFAKRCIDATLVQFEGGQSA